MTDAHRRPSGLGEVTDLVLSLEEELGLLDRRIDGVAFWERIRFMVHRQVLVRSGIMDPATAKASPAVRFARKVRQLRPVLQRSALAGPRECDVIFFGSGRRVRDEVSGWQNPDLGPLLPSCDIPATAVEFLGSRPWSPTATGVPTYFLDRIGVRDRIRRAVGRRVAVPPDEASLLADISRRLADQTGVRLNLAGLAADALTTRHNTLDLYDRVLEASGAGAVVIAVAYFNPTAVEAAQRRDIPVIELQHGVISRHHLGYHYPAAAGRPSVFPDWVLTWGDYWAGAAEWPLPQERLLPTGFPRFDQEKGRAEESGEGDHPDAILFLSQTMLGERLSRVAAELAGLGFRDRIIYRLHPREETDWRRRYPWLAGAGVRVSGAADPLYPLLRSVPVHVGTFSTALFEGLGMGAQLYLVEAPGIEYMNDLIERGDATPVGSARDLAAQLDRAGRMSRERASSERFFRPAAVDRTWAAIRSIAGLGGSGRS